MSLFRLISLLLFTALLSVSCLDKKPEDKTSTSKPKTVSEVAEEPNLDRYEVREALVVPTKQEPEEWDSTNLHVEALYIPQKSQSPSPPIEMIESDKPVYNRIETIGFRNVLDAPLCTFSIDVDTAAYANVRNYLSQGKIPPQDAIRIEEIPITKSAFKKKHLHRRVAQLVVEFIRR